MGLKVYSPNEQLISFNYIEDGGMLNPWWYMNQVVSYKFSSRAGNKTQLKQLINTCRSLNLRIYADININSMTGQGIDRYDDHINYNEGTNSCDHWGSRESTGGSPFWTVGFRYENNPYTGLEPGLEYPAVPYFPSDFHCDYTINNYFDANDLNGGWVSGLADLNTEKEFVQQRIVDFYIELLSIGFSGFSLQNAKHIYPSTHATLFRKLKIGLGK
jgi:alpha-amylase